MCVCVCVIKDKDDMQIYKTKMTISASHLFKVEVQNDKLKINKNYVKLMLTKL